MGVPVGAFADCDDVPDDDDDVLDDLSSSLPHALSTATAPTSVSTCTSCHSLRRGAGTRRALSVMGVVLLIR
jgi:hypothetical protein